MSRQTGLSTKRRLAPWLLFFAWLAISAAQLWVREIDAVRLGVLGCFSPARSETAALAHFLSGRLLDSIEKGSRQTATVPAANELVTRDDAEDAARNKPPLPANPIPGSPHS